MIELYHGSDVIIEKPLTNIGRRNLDFGPGFYLTELKDQAIQWAKRICVQRGSSVGIVSKYEFEYTKAQQNYNIIKFESYDEKWLEFIINSRNGKSPWDRYDIIEGGIANDKVIEAIEAYIAGYASVETTLGLLAFAKPNHQICIRNQKIIDNFLKYKSYIDITL